MRRVLAFQLLRHPEKQTAGIKLPSRPASAQSPRHEQVPPRVTDGVELSPTSAANRARSAPAATAAPLPKNLANHRVPGNVSPPRGFTFPGFFHAPGLPRSGPFVKQRASYRAESPLTSLPASSDSFPEAPRPEALEDVFSVLDPVHSGGSPATPAEVMVLPDEEGPTASPVGQKSVIPARPDRAVVLITKIGPPRTPERKPSRHGPLAPAHPAASPPNRAGATASPNSSGIPADNEQVRPASTAVQVPSQDHDRMHLSPIKAGILESGRGYHDTPHRKIIRRGEHFLSESSRWPRHGMENVSPPSPIINSQFDVGFGRHTPPPHPTERGAPWDPDHDDQDGPPMALIDEWYHASCRHPANRFLNPQPLPFSQNNATNADAEPGMSSQPARQQPARAVSSHRQSHDPHLAGDVFEEAVKPLVEESDNSDDADAFLPPCGDQEDDESNLNDSDSPSRAQVKARRKSKGKAAQRDASTAASDSAGGRPTIKANQEIEATGHRIQSEIAALATNLGLSYDTVMRKMGLTQQGIREPTLANVFRKVNKHRLLVNGEGRLIYYSNRSIH